MSIELGKGGTIPTGIGNPIVIPSSEAPEKQLKVSEKISNLQNIKEGKPSSYKFLASISDNVPGFLSEKINTSQFDIYNQKLRLISFDGLSTDDLTEGISNLFYSTTQVLSDLSFHTDDDSIHFSDLSNFNSDNLSEGASNLYYRTSKVLSDMDFHTSDDSIHLSNLLSFTTNDLAEGGSNLYYTTARMLNDIDFHVNDNSIHFSDLTNFTSDDLPEGITNLYYSSSKVMLDLAFHIDDASIHFDDLTNFNTDGLQEGIVNLYYTQARVLSSMEFHTNDDSIHFSDLTNFNTDNLAQGTVNLYLNPINFDTYFAAKNTDDVAEGITNLYYNSSLFNTDFATKTTSNLTEGSNLYYTNARAIAALDPHTTDASIHFSDLSSFSTDDLAEGSNKYISTQQATDITDNKTYRHEHANKVLLDEYNQSNANIANAISLAHSHANKAILDATEESFTTALMNKYDAYEAGSISTVVLPLELNAGILSHLDGDGYNHIPSNNGVPQFRVLATGTNPGETPWTTIEDVIANSSVLESTPSSSTTKGVQSNYINNHISNSIANVKHVTDADLIYIGTTIPNHIADIKLHVPAFSSADNGKFLYINGSTQLDWSTSTSIVTTSGEDYLDHSGSDVIAKKIDISHTNLAEGNNITFSGNTISATQRAISGSSINGDNSTSISAGWAYSHEVKVGSLGHVPSGGNVNQYIDGTGALREFTDSPGQTYKIIMGPGSNGTVAERLADATFPAGWSGAVGAVTTDLIITHDTESEVTDVTIFADDGTDITKLVGTAPYTTIIGNQTNTEIKIASLTTIREDIRIYIKFL